MSKGPQITVIGAGIAGICAACELALRGAHVTVIESNRHAGGDVHVLRDRRFSFDTGPVVLTNPKLIEDLFTRAGRDAADYYRLFELDPQPRFWFDDGVVLNLSRRNEVFARMLNQQFPLTQPGAEWQQGFDRSNGDQTRVRKSTKDPYVHRVQSYDAGYSLSDRAEHGMWYPMGGMREVVKSLERLASELGVQFRFGGSQSEMATLRAEESVQTLSSLKMPVGKPRARLSFFLGLSKRFEHLTFLNVFPGTDERQDLDTLEKGDGFVAEPAIEVVSPCIIDPSHAPAGGDAMRVTVFMPQSARSSNKPGDHLNQYRSAIMNKLKRFGMGDIEDRIVAQYVLTPPDYATMSISAGQCHDISETATAGISTANTIFGASSFSASGTLKSVRVMGVAGA